MSPSLRGRTIAAILARRLRHCRLAEGAIPSQAYVGPKHNVPTCTVALCRPLSLTVLTRHTLYHATTYLTPQHYCVLKTVGDGSGSTLLVVTTTLLVVTPFLIFYAICMRNHRIIIRNVVEGTRMPGSAYAPISSQLY